MSHTQTLEVNQVLTASEQYNGFSSGLSQITQAEIQFSKGLSAFEDYKSFTYKKEPRLKPFIYMHSTYDSNVSFVCVDPYILTPSYNVELSVETMANLGLEKMEDALVLCLVSVGKDMYTTTANLMSPIVINTQTMKGEQVIMEHLGVEFLRYNVWNSIGKYTVSNLSKSETEEK
jgi:flagellar assembly factor FliW